MCVHVCVIASLSVCSVRVLCVRACACALCVYVRTCVCALCVYVHTCACVYVHVCVCA
jgi:hypothetical protein